MLTDFTMHLYYFAISNLILKTYTIFATGDFSLFGYGYLQTLSSQFEVVVINI